MRLAAVSAAVALVTLAACAAFDSADDRSRGRADGGASADGPSGDDGGSGDDGVVFPFDASSALRIFLSYGQEGLEVDGVDVLAESECAENGATLAPPGIFVPFVAMKGRPIESHVDAAAPYVAIREDGGVVPLGRGFDLLAGTLLHPVSADPLEVWTGSGTGAANCNDWSVDDAGASGVRGRADLTDGGWLEWDSGLCDEDIRVYCIETGADVAPD